MKFPIRAKLILAVCLPLLAVYLGVCAIDYHIGRDQAIAQMTRHLTELTAHLACEIDKDLASVAQTARNTANMMTQFPLHEQQQIEALLRSNVRDTPGAFGAALAFEPRAFAPDRERYAPYVCRGNAGSDLQSKDVPYDYLQWDWYLLPKRVGRLVWTEP